MKRFCLFLFFLFLALLPHAGFLLFGGILLPKAKENHGTTQEVELVGPEEAKKEEKPPETPLDELKTEDEKPPDATEILKSLDTPPAPNEGPAALDAVSLAEIERALSGGGSSGGDVFGAAASLEGGGALYGTGRRRGGDDDKMDDAFSLADIDQKPRPVFQSAPAYPSEMRARKLEGVVSVLFIVDSSGKVQNPRVEKSNNPAFEKPALDAVRKWKFEPGVKGGQRVACKMRAPIRFQPG